jgi:hypothetical protein
MDGTADRPQDPEPQGVTMAQEALDHALGRLDVTIPEQVFEAGKLGTVSEVSWPDMLIAIGGSVIMSVIATIALSRKSGAQGFITVEDFYGGFAIGALIGYGGAQYFEKAAMPAPDQT